MPRVRTAFRVPLRGVPVALLVALLLPACRSLPVPAPGAEPMQEQYAGRFSLAVTRNEPGRPEHREAWSGRFSLAVGTQGLSLDLVSPLGATMARIETQPQEARLSVPADGGLQVESGPDAESLSQRVLGWSLPLEGMPDWVRGHPAAARPYRRLAAADSREAAAAERFEQDGWTVDVERPQDPNAGLRVRMQRGAHDDAPEVVLRVVLDARAAAPR